LWCRPCRIPPWETTRPEDYSARVAKDGLGYHARAFVPAFSFLYVLSVAIFALGQWDQAAKYNLEPPLVAQILGIAISNLIGLPKWLDDGFRVEFYVKTGIVLLAQLCHSH
jgi:uncharacterized membrane protein YadS